MALPVTSGTASFLVTRDDIINAALRSLRVLAMGDTPLTSDVTNCAFALNLILKTLNTDGLLKWVYQNVPVPTVANKNTYTIGETGCDVTALRPVNLTHAWRRDQSTPPIDTPLLIYGRERYDELTSKTQTGIPTTICYEALVTNGLLDVWLMPADTTYTLYLASQRPIQDITSSTQNFDVTQEWFEPLRWMLADSVAPEYEVDLKTIQMISQRAMFWRNKVADATQEDTSVFFMPSQTPPWGSGGNFSS